MVEDDARHVFVFLHHVLWWNENAAWWREVHPLLVRHPVRAVFAGDYGPLKFSATRRDGIQYVQSSVAWSSSPEMLHALEMSRLLHFQLDTFVVVDVEGDRLSWRVPTVGTLHTERYSPERFRAIYAGLDRSWRDRVHEALGGPLRRTALATGLLAAFALGLWTGRRTRRS